MLVLEDLHWADERTVDLLGYLLRNPPPELSLVLTYRSEEVPPGLRAMTARRSALRSWRTAASATATMRARQYQTKLHVAFRPTPMSVTGT